ncbi:NAD(P)H-dependent oxidoreductase [Streptomyces sp. MUM 203J]|uniref:NAD(P)H-dependent oxidoreductase n=1 Tax=Streptomyces sp. MUM 203J TaxID=2791990 RepID=UPI001F035EE2|nr:NAD(P)H-dependent oxidoreductase [Streptomyces sp. MUM 203J]MCH0542429.1 NAD(P)H-dependent oxidoreductase [Streptomyces sp. MUM 203J]
MSARILTLVGSLRAGSTNRGLAEAARTIAPEGVAVELYEGLGDVPFYNEDIDTEATLPEAAARLRAAVAGADALLLVVPEYNGTMPAVLKNAIDWLSRPYGAGAITKKPVAVIGAAFGQYGGEWAQAEARKAAGVAGGSVVEDVKLAIPGSLTRFAETHPSEDAEVLTGLSAVLASLTAAVTATATA